MPNEYLMLGDGSITGGQSFLSGLPGQTSSSGGQLRGTALQPIDVSNMPSDITGQFSYEGSPYYLSNTGAVYNQQGDPYGLMFNSGKMYQYSPGAWAGSNEGPYIGTFTDDMFSPYGNGQPTISSPADPAAGAYSMYTLEGLNQETLAAQAGYNPSYKPNYAGPHLQNVTPGGVFNVNGNTAYLTQNMELYNPTNQQVYGSMRPDGTLLDMSGTPIGTVDPVSGRVQVYPQNATGTFSAMGGFNPFGSGSDGENTGGFNPNYGGPTANLANMSIAGTFTSTLGQTAYLTTDGQMVNAQTGQVYGRMLDDGTLVDMSGQVLGKVDQATGAYEIYHNGSQGTFRPTGSGDQLDPDIPYPMDPLTNAFNRPEMQAYLNMLANLSTPEYLAQAAEPFLQNAYQRIGRSGARSSSFSDRLIADSFDRAYLSTVPQLIGGMAAVPGMLATLADPIQEPYQQALDYILALNLGVG